MKKYIFAGVAIVVLAIVALLVSQGVTPPVSETADPQTTNETAITIWVPQDIAGYETAINECAGGKQCIDAYLKTSTFVKKELSVPYTSDVVKASALAAANVIPTQAGALSIAYWKIQGTTAYVVLNIDLDGWAGVSMSLAKIRPIIEKALLQFPQIKTVVFGFAAGDNRENSL